MSVNEPVFVTFFAKSLIHAPKQIKYIVTEAHSRLPIPTDEDL